MSNLVQDITSENRSSHGLGKNIGQSRSFVQAAETEIDDADVRSDEVEVQINPGISVTTRI